MNNTFLANFIGLNGWFQSGLNESLPEYFTSKKTKDCLDKICSAGQGLELVSDLLIREAKPWNH